MLIYRKTWLREDVKSPSDLYDVLEDLKTWIDECPLTEDDVYKMITEIQQELL